MAEEKHLNLTSWKGIADLCLWADGEGCVVHCTISYKGAKPVNGILTVEAKGGKYYFDHPAFAAQGKRFVIWEPQAEGQGSSPEYRLEKDKVLFIGDYELKKKE